MVTLEFVTLREDQDVETAHMWHHQSRSITPPVKRHRGFVPKAHVSEPNLAGSNGFILIPKVSIVAFNTVALSVKI